MDTVLLGYTADDIDKYETLRLGLWCQNSFFLKISLSSVHIKSTENICLKPIAYTIPPLCVSWKSGTKSKIGLSPYLRLLKTFYFSTSFIFLFSERVPKDNFANFLLSSKLWSYSLSHSGLETFYLFIYLSIRITLHG